MTSTQKTVLLSTIGLLALSAVLIPLLTVGRGYWTSGPAQQDPVSALDSVRQELERLSDTIAATLNSTEMGQTRRKRQAVAAPAPAAATTVPPAAAAPVAAPVQT